MVGPMYVCVCMVGGKDDEKTHTGTVHRGRKMKSNSNDRI